MPEVVYNTYNMYIWDLPDIYARALLACRLGHIYQANPSCPYGHNAITITYVLCIYLICNTCIFYMLSKTIHQYVYVFMCRADT